MSTIPRPEYPRPQFFRDSWLNLNGSEWSYEFDFGQSGVARGLCASKGFSKSINVPFCPESELSGVGYTDFIPAMFYHRKLAIPEEWGGKRVLLNFGAVDYECEGFINGASVGCHRGGSSSFSFDLTNYVAAGNEYDFVLRVKDDVRSGIQASGKQSVNYASSGCHYTRVTGIWQTVWLEAVALTGLKRCRITPDWDNGAFTFTPEYWADPCDCRLRIQTDAEGKQAACGEFKAASGVSHVLPVSIRRDWSPDDPFLYDIILELLDADNNVIGRVSSYAGLRKIEVSGKRVFLNGVELFQRLVLDQGFYPDGIWTAPSDEALKRDIMLSQAAGFNGARLHQKVFEERFHYWADKLGYLTWGETPSWGAAFLGVGGTGALSRENYWQGAYNFSNEWREIVLRDVNHPSIIVWTPANETATGANLADYRHIMRELYMLTKDLDPTRPVNDTSGYYHVKSDLWTVHLYTGSAAELETQLCPAGAEVYSRPEDYGYCGQPYLLDEFGGFGYVPPERKLYSERSWSYYGFERMEEVLTKISEQVDIVIKHGLAGYCYTQLTDVEQEENGIYNYDRSEKFPMDKIREIFLRRP